LNVKIECNPKRSVNAVQRRRTGISHHTTEKEGRKLQAGKRHAKEVEVGEKRNHSRRADRGEGVSVDQKERSTVLRISKKNPVTRKKRKSVRKIKGQIWKPNVAGTHVHGKVHGGP